MVDFAPQVAQVAM